MCGQLKWLFVCGMLARVCGRAAKMSSSDIGESGVEVGANCGGVWCTVNLPQDPCQLEKKANQIVHSLMMTSEHSDWSVLKLPWHNKGLAIHSVVLSLSAE